MTEGMVTKVRAMWCVVLAVILAAMPASAGAKGGQDCEFPELRTPRTLEKVDKHGVTASVVCTQSANANVTLRVSAEDRRYFGLKSRVIGGGAGALAAGQPGKPVADLRSGVARKLARSRGTFVYFIATVEVPADDGETLELSRFDRFEVTR